MSYYDYKAQLDALSERERQIWDLHRKATNAMGFALQNIHSDRVMEKYETQAGDATSALWKLLTEGVK